MSVIPSRLAIATSIIEVVWARIDVTIVTSSPARVGFLSSDWDEHVFISEKSVTRLIDWFRITSQLFETIRVSHYLEWVGSMYLGWLSKTSRCYKMRLWRFLIFQIRLLSDATLFMLITVLRPVARKSEPIPGSKCSRKLCQRPIHWQEFQAKLRWYFQDVMVIYR